MPESNFRGGHGQSQLLERLNLNHLPAFLAVAEHCSFRAAAQRMHISQSALSVQIRQLERMLGVPLFHRTTRSVNLTAEGQRLQAVARRATEELGQIAMELREDAQLQRGVVNVAVLPSLAATGCRVRCAASRCGTRASRSACAMRIHGCARTGAAGPRAHGADVPQ
ncbi:LysR family transcriptional regulator [Ramlibacter terrae]|uniref:LysR family transcriptional regulator n=1 Tax=Ramlibacter terrae TaxID=2732511 RepID=A0ABX6NZY5_9BURK|nr:LysR family transcriptional regulator [Ramlibacter terrae]